MDAERREEVVSACDSKLEEAYSTLLDTYRILKRTYGPTCKAVRQLDMAMKVVNAARNSLERYGTTVEAKEPDDQDT